MSSTSSSQPLGISVSVQSTYYPPGWNRDRLIGASKDDLFNLPPEEFEKMRQGMMSAMGPEVFQHFINDLLAKELPAENNNTQTSETTPLMLKVLKKQYQGSEWGFVVFRAASYDDEERWQQFRRIWGDVMQMQLDEYKRCQGIQEARERLKFTWVERAELQDESLENIARWLLICEESSEYTSKHLMDYQNDSGVKQSLCLVVTPESFSSLLNTQPSTLQNAGDTIKVRADAPFVVALAGLNPNEVEEEEEEEEEENNLVHFNVAIETILTELFATIGAQSISPQSLGGHLTGKQNSIWFAQGLEYREGRPSKSGGRRG